MKALALTFPGLSDVLAEEIKTLTGISGKQGAESVSFEAELKDIFAVCYRSQAACRVLLVVSEGAFEQLTVPKEYLTGTVSFAAKSTSKAQAFAETVSGKKVYKNADTPFYLHIEATQCWLGVDLTGDISKRDYRVFIGSETLSGITAFGALMTAGYEPKQIVLDPFCRAGSFVIEAALHALSLPVRLYSKDRMPYAKTRKDFDFEKFYKEHDKHVKESPQGTIFALSPQFPSIQATRKNAKIAGVGKAIDFSRTETDWLDFKFEKNSVDRIVTQPVERTINFPQDKFTKLASLFFERSAAILKKNGRLCLVLRQGKDDYIAIGKQNKFSLEHERVIMQGKEAWNVMVFTQT
jgi:23S rRNA G2445 N2-methylase RlmL